jgi:hypothetical protein
MHKADSFFVTRAKVTLDYEVVEQNYNLDETTGLRSDKTINLAGPSLSVYIRSQLRLVEYYDVEKRYRTCLSHYILRSIRT